MTCLIIARSKLIVTVFHHKIKFNAPQLSSYQLIRDSDEDSIDDFVAVTLVEFRSKCYSQVCGPYKWWSWQSFLEQTQQLFEIEFLLLFQMYRESIDLLLALLNDHLVFHHCTVPAGNLLWRKYPVQLQIMVFLYLLCASNSNCNFKWIGARFFISQGVARLFVTRVTMAICRGKKKK